MPFILFFEYTTTTTAMSCPLLFLSIIFILCRFMHQYSAFFSRNSHNFYFVWRCCSLGYFLYFFFILGQQHTGKKIKEKKIKWERENIHRKIMKMEFTIEFSSIILKNAIIKCNKSRKMWMYEDWELKIKIGAVSRLHTRRMHKFKKKKVWKKISYIKMWKINEN